MRRPIRHILLVSLIALYGAITVAGPSLHSLPGFEPTHEGSLDAGPKAPQHGHPVKSSDDCSICQFHLLGQIATESVEITTIDVVAALPDETPSLFAPARPRAAASPRAPPFV